MKNKEEPRNLLEEIKVDDDDCDRHKALSRLDHHNHSPVDTVDNFNTTKSFLETIQTHRSKQMKNSFYKKRSTHQRLRSLRTPKYYRGHNVKAVPAPIQEHLAITPSNFKMEGESLTLKHLQTTRNISNKR